MTILAAIKGERGSTSVVHVGKQLAATFQEEFVVLHVMPNKQFDHLQGSQTDSDLPPDIKSDIDTAVGMYTTQRDDVAEESDDGGYYLDDGMEDAANVVRRFLSESTDSQPSVRARGRIGDATTEILSEAERVAARYVVVGGHKRTPVGKAVFGSTTQSILLQTELPVVTVPQSYEMAVGDKRPVIVAVDRSERAPRTVREAKALAEALQAPLHAVHVLTRNASADLDASGDDWDGGSEEIETAATSIAREAADTADGNVIPVGLVGEPSRQIIEYASDQDASYIVTAGRKRSPVGKVLFGSVTQSILLSADRPVVSVMSES